MKLILIQSHVKYIVNTPNEHYIYKLNKHKSALVILNILHYIFYIMITLVNKTV